MDADGDYIPRSVLKGNVKSIVAWTAWKQVKYNGKSKSLATEKGIHRSTHIPSNNLGQSRAP
jgi:hypothetical protein